MTRVDLSSDPLYWPMPADEPTTADGWAEEYQVTVERMQEEPANYWAKRLRLHELAGDPPPDFKRRVVIAWYYAGTNSPMPGIRPSGLDYAAHVGILDRLVSAERSRQIRARIAPGATGAAAGDPTSDPRLIASRGDVERVRDALLADGKRAGYKSIAKAGGWSVATVRRRLTGH